MKKLYTSDLYTLPNLGPKSIAHLENIKITSIADLQKHGPEKVYDRLCTHYKTHMHMAFLYVLRAAHSYSIDRIDWEGAKRWWMFRSPQDKDLVLYYKQKFNKK